MDHDKYLGTIVNMNGCMDQEIRNLSRSAMNALCEIRQFLRLKVGRATNLLAVKLFVVSRLMYASQCWPQLNIRNLAVIRGAYMKAVRVALGEDFSSVNDVANMITDSQLILKYKVTDITFLIFASLTKFFGRIVAHAPESLRTLLTATVGIENSFSCRVQADM